MPVLGGFARKREKMFSTQQINESLTSLENFNKSAPEPEIEPRHDCSVGSTPLGYNQPANMGDLLAEQEAWAISEYELRGGAFGIWWHNIITLPWLLILGGFAGIFLGTLLIFGLYFQSIANIFTVTGVAIFITAGIMALLSRN